MKTCSYFLNYTSLFPPCSVTCQHLANHSSATCTAFRCHFSNTMLPLSSRLLCVSSHSHPNDPSRTPLHHLLVWHVCGTAWCPVLPRTRRREGWKTPVSFLLFRCAPIETAPKPPTPPPLHPPTVSICSSLSGAGWGGGETCIHRHTQTYMGCKHMHCWHACAHNNQHLVHLLESHSVVLQILARNAQPSIAVSDKEPFLTAGNLISVTSVVFQNASSWVRKKIPSESARNSCYMTTYDHFRLQMSQAQSDTMLRSQLPSREKPFYSLV